MKTLSECIRTKIKKISGCDEEIFILQERWAEIVGSDVSQYTLPLSLYQKNKSTKCLAVLLMNASIAIELHHMLGEISQKIATLLGCELIVVEIKMRK